MRGKMIVVNVDGTIIKQNLSSVPPLKVLNEKIGGFLESIPYFNKVYDEGEIHNCVAFCNQHGKINGEPSNSTATLMWFKSFTEITKQPAEALDDYIAGNVVILYGDDEFMNNI